MHPLGVAAQHLRAAADRPSGHRSRARACRGVRRGRSHRRRLDVPSCLERRRCGPRRVDVWAASRAWPQKGAAAAPALDRNARARAVSALGISGSALCLEQPRRIRTVSRPSSPWCSEPDHDWPRAGLRWEERRVGQRPCAGACSSGKDGKEGLFFLFRQREELSMDIKTSTILCSDSCAPRSPLTTTSLRAITGA